MNAFIPSAPVSSAHKRSVPVAASLHPSNSSAVQVHQRSLDTFPRSASQTSPISQPSSAVPDGPPVAIPSSTTVIWLREDLRLHDNPALTAAVSADAAVAPLVIYNGKRDQFWIESVMALRHSLRARGAELYIRHATSNVPNEIEAFCMETGATRVHYHRGVSQEAIAEEKAVSNLLSNHGVTVEAFWTNSLVTPQELPFAVKDMPEDCDEFSNAMLKLKIGEPVAAPDNIRGVSYAGVIEAGDILVENKSEKSQSLRGGEQCALERLHDYVGGKSLVEVSGSVGVIDTKFGRLGPFLSAGCLSPRRLYHEVIGNVNGNSVRRYCAEFELALRDFFRFLTLKHGVHPV